MNKLYQVLYPGSYLPWCIVLIYYLLHLEISNFVSASTYVIICVMKLSHMEFYNKNVIHWSLAQKICEFSLILRLITMNQTGSSFFGVSVATVTCALLGTLPLNKRVFIMQPPFYALILLFLCSVSLSHIQTLSSIVLILLTLHQWKHPYTYNTITDMENNLLVHFNMKIMESYLIFLLEWANSDLHWMSLPIVIILSALFQLNAYYNIPYKKEDYEEFYMYMNNLPKDYPIPLNFYHARDHCNIANKVFKRHQI